MCGILGIALARDCRLAKNRVRSALCDLLLFSESRGKEAAGLAVLAGDRLDVLKSAVPASGMVRAASFRELLARAFERGAAGARPDPLAIIGHSRLVTTGSQYNNANNQPVIAGNAVGIHNGIIVNHEALWRKHPELARRSEVDTEVLLALMSDRRRQGQSLDEAVRATYGEIEGTASVAVLFADLDTLLLATNNGSLYYGLSRDGDVFAFASERYILQRIARRHGPSFVDASRIRHVAAGSACAVDLRSLAVAEFAIDPPSARLDVPLRPTPRTIREVPGVARPAHAQTAAQSRVGLSDLMDRSGAECLARVRDRFPHDAAWSDSLRRCTRCVLPETMPFIHFDEHGVCNYCRNYRPLAFQGAAALRERVDRHRHRDGTPDCVVSVSGGRDSLYSLHYATRELGLNCVAYTYDWGMVTDLARRNISRACAKLGIEHILISADITRKRRNIRRNVEAWLRRPRLGLIPLFMAGDKQYFYHLQKVREQTGAGLTLMGENMLERTDFKTGFAGIAPYNRDAHHIYSLPLWGYFKLAAFYGREYLLNPRYLNASMLDTVSAYICFYFLDRDFVNLYNYIPWDEKTVIPTLLDEYRFELATDSRSTWRIGDGTAAFYNYIYYTVAGFTENDTFRSNQIREGLITREDALARVREENRPRYEGIYWYLSIIELGLPMEDVLALIHRIPKIARP